MQVHRGRNDGFGADDFSYPLNKITFGIVQPHNAHGAVNIKI